MTDRKDISAGDLDRHELGEWLSAFLDGELDEEQSALVQKIIATDQDAKLLYAELESTAQAVNGLPRETAPGSILDDIRFQLERRELFGHEDEEETARSRASINPFSRWATAAVLGFAVMGGLYAVLDSYRLKSPETIAVDDLNASTSAIDRGPDESDLAFDTVAMEGPVLPLGPADQDYDTLAILNLEQKIQSGFRGAVLASHSFSNESNRLEIPVASELDAEFAQRRLLHRMAAYGLKEATSDAALGEESGVFLEGRSGVNFDDRNARQLLVRLPANQVQSLYADVEQLSSQTTDMYLQVDSFRQQGPTNIRHAIAVLTEQDDPDLVRPKEDEQSPSETVVLTDADSNGRYGIFQDIVDALQPGASQQADTASRLEPSDKARYEPTASIAFDDNKAARKPEDAEPDGRKGMNDEASEGSVGELDRLAVGDTTSGNKKAADRVAVANRSSERIDLPVAPSAANGSAREERQDDADGPLMLKNRGAVAKREASGELKESTGDHPVIDPSSLVSRRIRAAKQTNRVQPTAELSQASASSLPASRGRGRVPMVTMVIEFRPIPPKPVSPRPTSDSETKPSRPSTNGDGKK